jgi:hypothetical protein
MIAAENRGLSAFQNNPQHAKLMDGKMDMVGTKPGFTIK